jgi:catechol 2,3-dioxygenase-like lactoylglutathione lyase family enzyme
MSRPVLTHIALHVRELARSVAFYREFCGLEPVRNRGEGGDAVVWLAEPGREREFIFVLIAGGPGRTSADGDFSHFGFALDTREQVDAIAARAQSAGCLLWPPREEPYPVGYYCGVRDPDGNSIEFSFGQPLGPGAEAAAN